MTTPRQYSPKNARQREMQRLIRYAQGMGCQVVVRPYIPRSHFFAEWELFDDNAVLITLYRQKRQSDLQMVLSIIHELGHHRDFITLGRRDISEPNVKRGQPQSERKRIYDYELRAMKYWKQIYHDCDCRFPIWRLFMQMEIDIHAYQYYYEHGKDQPTKIRNSFRKQTRDKHQMGFEAETFEPITVWHEDTDTEVIDGPTPEEQNETTG